MSESKPALSQGRKPPEIDSLYKLELIKQKISFQKLIFAQALAIAAGIAVWLLTSSTDPSRGEASPLFKWLSFEPAEVGIVLLFLTMTMMLAALSSIHHYIGELGDPGMKRMGWLMPAGVLVTVSGIVFALYSDILPMSGKKEDILRILVTALTVNSLFVFVFILPYRKLMDWTKRRILAIKKDFASCRPRR